MDPILDPSMDIEIHRIKKPLLRALAALVLPWLWAVPEDEGAGTSCMSRETPPLPPCALAATMRFLTNGHSYKKIAMDFGMSKRQAKRMIIYTCNVISKCLETYMPQPTPELWNQLSQQFNDIHGLPLCCGSLDGSLLAVRRVSKLPACLSSGLRTKCVFLFTVFDANYKIVTFETLLRTDAHINFKNSEMWRMIKENSGLFDLAPSKSSSANEKKVSMFFAAPPEFPLTRNILRPFPTKSAIFATNKHLFNKSFLDVRKCYFVGARSLFDTFRILRGGFVPLKFEELDLIVGTCSKLHNFIISKEPIDKELYPNIVPISEMEGYQSSATREGLWVRARVANMIRAKKDTKVLGD